jgi:hypothetical protein
VGGDRPPREFSRVLWRAGGAGEPGPGQFKWPLPLSPTTPPYLLGGLDKEPEPHGTPPFWWSGGGDGGESGEGVGGPIGPLEGRGVRLKIGGGRRAQEVGHEGKGGGELSRWEEASEGKGEGIGKPATPRRDPVTAGALCGRGKLSNALLAQPWAR